MSKPLCLAPWHSLYIEANGDVKNCCVAVDPIGNIAEPIKALSSFKNIEIKQELLENKLHDSCMRCSNVRSNPLYKHYGYWIHSDWKYPDKDYTTNTENELLYMDVRWKNTCTLKCMYCTPVFSSAWAKEENEGIPDNKQNFSTFKNNELIAKLPSLRKIYLAGGEPLLIKDNEWLLEELLRVNPDCEIIVNSNIQLLDTRVFELVQKFKKVDWLVSIDNVREKYEYVRSGSKWETFKNNLQTIMNIWSRQNITFNSVYHIFNLTDIINLLKYLYDLGFEDSFYNVDFAFGYFNPMALPLEPRIEAANELELFIKDYPNFENTLRPLINGLRNNESIDDIRRPGLKRLEQMNKINNKRWQDIWPELEKHLTID